VSKLPAAIERKDARDSGETFARDWVLRNRGFPQLSTRNGALTTAARLGELGALLVDLSGQHQHQGLVDPARHLEILDLFGSSAGEAAAMQAAWQLLRERDEAVQALSGDARERDARIDYLRFQLEELDGANLAAGEDASLELERVRLASVDLLQAAARLAEEQLYSGDSAARDLVASAHREIDRGLRTDPSLEPIARQLTEIESLLDDASDQLRAYADKLEGDPERLAWVDERIALIRRLVRKHGATNGLAELIGKAIELRNELAQLSSHEVSLVEAQTARATAEAAALSVATGLTKLRTKAAKKLEKEVGAALRSDRSPWVRVHAARRPRIASRQPC